MMTSVRSVANAFAILRLLTRSGPLSLTAIAQELDLSPSSCLNLLRTLVDQGAIERDGKSKQYRLARDWEEAKLFDSGRDQVVIERLQAAMTQCAREFDATIGLWKVTHDRRLQLITHAECNAAMRIQLADGQRQPLGGGAVGRALAAAQHCSDTELARRFAEVRWQAPLPFNTYREEVAFAESQGFAIDDGLAFAGVCSLAAPLLQEPCSYLISASIFAGSRSEAEIHAIGSALARIAADC